MVRGRPMSLKVHEGAEHCCDLTLLVLIQSAAGISSGQREALTHHVLLLSVQSNLAEGKPAQNQVDASCDEAVVAHGVIETVDLLNCIWIFWF